MPENERRIRELEEKVTQNITLLERLDADIYNHGRDGIKTILTKFIEEQTNYRDNREKEEKRKEAADKKFRDWIKIALTLIAVLITGFGLLYEIEGHATGRLHFPHLFGSQNADPVYAIRKGDQQDTYDPSIRSTP